jgi:mannitol/fructose-specific phosphotransferase system IIA component (Ntr-type)
MLKRRENLGSTGIGRGIAIPHCRSLVVNRLRVAFGRKPEGVDFNAIDNQPVRNFFLIVAPPLEVSNQYLPVLGRLAQFAKVPDMSRKLEGLGTPEEFVKLVEDNAASESGRWPGRTKRRRDSPAPLFSRQHSLLGYRDLLNDVLSIDLQPNDVDSRSYFRPLAVQAVPVCQIVTRLRVLQVIDRRAVSRRMIERRRDCNELPHDIVDRDRNDYRLPLLKQPCIQTERNPCFRIEGVRVILPQLETTIPACRPCLLPEGRRCEGSEGGKEDDTDADHASHRHLRTESAVL